MSPSCYVFIFSSLNEHFEFNYLLTNLVLCFNNALQVLWKNETDRWKCSFACLGRCGIQLVNSNLPKYTDFAIILNQSNRIFTVFTFVLETIKLVLRFRRCMRKPPFSSYLDFDIFLKDISCSKYKYIRGPYH